MPKSERVCVGTANTFVPFYGALLTDVPKVYKMNGTKKVYGAWSYIRKVTIKK